MNDILLPIVQTINAYLSDYVLIILLIGCGLYFSIRTKFVQVRCFGEGMKNVFGKLSLKGGKQGGGMSSFQALATAIAAQVGTGNIVGASGAILVGGPGAIFWMWIIAFLGMATIYAEAVLAQKTRVVKENGEVLGGPVYYIRTAFKGTFGKILAGFFAIAIILALGFFGCMVQSNSIGSTAQTAFGIPSWIYGGVIGLLVGAAMVSFVIMPTRIQSIRTDAQKQIREISSQSDGKDSQITDLQSQVEQLNADLKDLQEEQEKNTASGGENKTDVLMESAALYVEDSVKVADAAKALAKIDPETATEGMSDAYTKLYNDLYPLLRAEILQTFADSGITAYEASTPDYAAAAEDLETANKFEKQDQTGQTWAKRQYYLANSYYQLYLAAKDGSSDDNNTSAEEYVTKAKAVIANLAAKDASSEYTTKANALLAQLPEVTAGSAAASGEVAGTGTSAGAEESTGTANANGTSAGAAGSTGAANANGAGGAQE